jgi:hypothetical protein
MDFLERAGRSSGKNGNGADDLSIHEDCGNSDL